MIEGSILEKIDESSGGAAFFIGATEDDAADAAMHDGSGAHGTGFFGDENIAMGEPPVADGALGLGEGQHFCVGSGVAEEFDLIGGPADDVTFMDDDGADRNFFLAEGLAGFAQSLAHEELIAGTVDGILSGRVIVGFDHFGGGAGRGQHSPGE